MESNSPSDLRTIAPYLTVHDASALIDFLIALFDAQVILEKRYEDNKVQHARIQIGNSVLMINESTEEYPIFNAQMHIYVDNTELAFERAVGLGATSLMKPNTRPHGDRMAGVKDPFGNVWWIATQA